MRELSLNGYIASEAWYSDEISPEQLHDMLYEPGSDPTEEVHITLNSYGGDCNAATRMHDDIVTYPGKVNITISGTAASAATVLVQAADFLEMTSGSLFMIHDPSLVAFGNERDLTEAINLLRACKQSIINVYGKRCRKDRNEISDLMTATTWMDAQEALNAGFIDAVADAAPEKAGITFNAVRADKPTAERMVAAWNTRRFENKPAKSGVSARNDADVENENSSNDARAESAETADYPIQSDEEIASVDETSIIADDTTADAEVEETSAEASVEDTATENRVSVEALEKRLALLNIQNI